MPNLLKTFVLIVAGLFASPTFAQDDLCGSHSVDDLFQDLQLSSSAQLDTRPVQLVDGVVFGVPIANVTAEMSLFRVDEEIGMMISGGGMAGALEANLDRVPKADALDFRGAGFAMDLEDFGTISECTDTSKIPQYFGPGHLLTPDGRTVPATVRMILWLGTNTTEGSQEPYKALFAVGVIRSEILNGKFLVIPGVS